MVIFGQSGCISAILFVLGQKWFYSGKSGCFRIKVVAFGQSGCIRAKWLYSGKSCYIRIKWLYFGKSGCIRQSSCNGEKWFIRKKLVVFG